MPVVVRNDASDADGRTPSKTKEQGNAGFRPTAAAVDVPRITLRVFVGARLRIPQDSALN